jgi:hypothetical protein
MLLSIFQAQKKSLMAPVTCSGYVVWLIVVVLLVGINGGGLNG